MAAETLVLYHIPSDRDDLEIPNGFLIPKPVEKISVKDIQEHFPLPGEYHFRVKQPGNSNFWLDLRPDQHAPLPAVGKRIVLKALRLSWSRAQPQPQRAAPQTVDDFDAFFG